MGLSFTGEKGAYLQSRDAIKIVAVDGDRRIDCYITRSALDAMGCPEGGGPDLLRHFERERDRAEIAAMVKHRRSLTPRVELHIEAADFAVLLPAAAA